MEQLVRQSPPDRGRATGEGYCAVTIVCGNRRWDGALPSAVPCAELLPGLLRLLRPAHEAAEQAAHAPAEQATHKTDERRADERTDQPPDGPVGPARWVLGPVGGRDLEPGDTLGGAGVLTGDLLLLRPSGHPASAAAPVPGTVRDQLEDAVDERGGCWDPRSARAVAAWTLVASAALLLIPALGLSGESPVAALAVVVAVIVAGTAVQSANRSEHACAATGVVVASGWAGLAGTQVARGWSAGEVGPAAGASAAIAVGTGSALLLAGCIAVVSPAALVHAAALLVVAGFAGPVAVAVTIGAPMAGTAAAAAVLAVLVVGGLPRIALAVSGLTGGGAAGADLAARMLRADRVLTGCVIGVSLVAVGAAPAALVGGGWLRLLAAVIGLMLVLRARVFSQLRHVLAPWAAAFVVFGTLWSALFRAEDQRWQGVLILVAVVAVATLPALAAALNPASSPIGAARVGRLLDAAEQLLVVALVVLTAGVLGLFDWASSVLG